MTLSEVTDISGPEGNFTVTVNRLPRYVHEDRCIACGKCSAACPVATPDEHNRGLSDRKAIHIAYAQAVPLTYRIDPGLCLHLNGSDNCNRCREVCPADAVDLTMAAKEEKVLVGAIIMAPGFSPYDPQAKGSWGYGILDNVITSPEMERLLSSCGPTRGRLLRPSDDRPVKQLAFIQCIGSRDPHSCGHGYCSAVCCMTAIKEAMIAKENDSELEVTVFYSDMRTHGKGFDRYFQRALDKQIHFVRCRPHGIEPIEHQRLRMRTINEQGKQHEVHFDMIVLSVGLEISEPTVKLARLAGIHLGPEHFASTSSFQPVLSSKKGIYICGAFSGPKNISLSVEQGSAAAAAVASLLMSRRNTKTRRLRLPGEQPLFGPVKTGVFLCHCGNNISETIDLKSVRKKITGLNSVSHVQEVLFSCSQDTRELIIDLVHSLGLNRIVIAACSPKTHEALFRRTIREAGLNEHLLEMANIRNQDSWVHSLDPAAATDKAVDLIKMAVAAVTLKQPVATNKVAVKQTALVVGGGVAGMTAAINLADQGFPVDLIEKTDRLGGNGLNLHRTWNGEHVPPYIKKLQTRVLEHPGITVHFSATVLDAGGHAGNFHTTIRDRKGHRRIITHGVGIIAVGGKRSLPEEYGYGKIPGVVAAVEFDALHIYNDIRVSRGSSFVFIQCVGSRDEKHNYCSRVCCTHSVQSAIELKKEDQNRQVYILFREMRTYGLRESLYNRALELGVIFINYEQFGKPKVRSVDKQITVEVWDHILRRPLHIKADMIILASGILPNPDATGLASLFRVNVDEDGFFQEAHPKLRPVDLPTDGLFVAGLAHAPKPMEESIAQALAASARAATLLSQTEIRLDPIKAVVDTGYCDGCALCIDVCPYRAITPIEETNADGEEHKLVAVDTMRCTGCGICQGTCPKRAINVIDFTYDQLTAKIEAALHQDG